MVESLPFVTDEQLVLANIKELTSSIKIKQPQDYTGKDATQVDSDLFSRLHLALTQELGANFLLFQTTIFLSILLCGVLALAAQLLSRDMVQVLEKKSPYECGFFPFDSATRLPFDVHFYVVGIMFLVFDVELIILTTIIILAVSMPWSALTSVAGFITILTIGFIYEWACGALRWEAKTPEPITISPSYSSAMFLVLLVLAEASCNDASNSSLFGGFTDFTGEFVTGALFGYHLSDGPPYLENDDERTRKNLGRLVVAQGRTVSRRKRLNSSRTGVVHSWRARRWSVRHPMYWTDYLYDSYKKYPDHDSLVLYNASPTKIANAPGRWRRKVRSFLWTRLLPSVHYHATRLHRWPLVMLFSFFVIPALTIPWFWFVEDYDIVWHDLTSLYKDVQAFAEKELRTYTMLHPWIRPLYVALLLYPAAVVRAFLRWNCGWPLMFLLSFAVAKNIWIFAPGGSTETGYRWWKKTRRQALYARRKLLLKRLNVYRDHYRDNPVTVHPDADYTDKHAQGFSAPVLFLAIAVFAPTFVEPSLGVNFFNIEASFLSFPSEAWPEPFRKYVRQRRFFGDINRVYEWYILHDIQALAKLLLARSSVFSLILIILGVQQGVSGILMYVTRYLMYPQQRRFRIPPFWSIFVLYWTAKAFFAFRGVMLQFTGNDYTNHPVAFTIAAIKLRWSTMETRGTSPLLNYFTFFFTLTALASPPIYSSLRNMYTRYVIGKLRAVTKRARRKRSYRNRAFTRVAIPGIFVPMIEYEKLLHDRRAENDRKRSRKKIQQICWPALLSTLSFTGLSVSTIYDSSMLPTTLNICLSFVPNPLALSAFTPLIFLITLLPLPLILWILELSGRVYESVPVTSTAINFLPEILMILSISVLLTFVAIEKQRGTDSKLLAIACWRNMCRAFILVGAVYVFQLMFLQIPSMPVFKGYAYTAPGLTFSKLIVLATSLLVLHSSEKYIREHVRPLIEYPIIVAVGVLLLLALVASNNLMTVFFTLAGFSLALYVLILFDGHSAPAREAGTKYFYLSTLSAGVILMGSFLIYHHVGSTNYFSIDTFFFSAETDHESRTICCTAVVFILFGFFFKLSAFPAHLWAPEVYEGSPSPVLAFFVLPVKVAIFLTFLRLLNTAFHEISHFWMPIVFLAAIGSLVWGALSAADSQKITRFLAYASINQIGFMLLGASMDTFLALRATYIYLLLYAVMTGGFMLAYLHTRREDGALLTYISDFSGLARTEPSVCWSTAIYLFSMAGIPPLAGFFSKYYILHAALARGTTGLVVIALVVSLLSAYYYLRIIATFWFGEPEAVPISTYAELSPLRRTLLVVIEATLWVFCVAGAPLFPEFDLIVWSFWTCG